MLAQGPQGGKRGFNIPKHHRTIPRRFIDFAAIFSREPHFLYLTTELHLLVVINHITVELTRLLLSLKFPLILSREFYTKLHLGVWFIKEVRLVIECHQGSV